EDRHRSTGRPYIKLELRTPHCTLASLVGLLEKQTAPGARFREPSSIKFNHSSLQLSRLKSEQALLFSPQRSLGASLNIHLLEYRPDMLVDRKPADGKSFGYLLVSQTAPDVQQNLEFP